MTHDLPLLLELPSTVKETSVWPRLASAIGSDGDALTVHQRRWLTIATFHVSALYESRELSSFVSPHCLSLLEKVGNSVLELELHLAIGRQTAGWDVGQRHAEKARLVSPVRRALVSRLGVVDHGRFGSGEQQQQAVRGQLSRSYERVALQLLGWWSLALSGRCIRGVVHEIHAAGAGSASLRGFDWRTIFENNFRKLSPTYSDTVVGPDHARTFEVCVTTRDGRSAVASGRRKKEAIQLACHAYLAAHAPRLLDQAEAAGPTASHRTGGIREVPVYTEHRNLAREFGGSDPQLFAKALTHSSWIYENLTRSDAGRDGNAVLANLGSSVLSTCFTRTRAAFLLSTTTNPDPDISMTLTLPDQELLPLAASLGLPGAALLGAGQQEQGISDEMAANFVQATLAAAFVQAPDQVVFEKRLPGIVSQFLFEHAGRSLLGPAAVLHRLSSELQFECEEHQTRSGPDHRSEFHVTTRLTAGDATVVVEGTGESLRAARKEAAQTALDADRLRTGDPLPSARPDVVHFLIERQLEALGTKRSRWPRWHRRNVLGATSVAAREWASFAKWADEVLRAGPADLLPTPGTVDVLAEYYGEAMRGAGVRPRFAGTLTRVIDWVIRSSTEDDEGAMLQSGPWAELLALSAAQSVWLAPHGGADLSDVIRDWALLNKRRAAVRIDVPVEAAAADNQAAVALLRILQECTPAANPGAPLSASLTPGATAHIVGLVPEHGWQQDPLGSPLIDLVCEASSDVVVRRTDREVLIEIGSGVLTSSGGWLWSAAKRSHGANDYDSELGRLVHDLKNEVSAARVSLTREVATRKQRKEAETAAIRHRDAAAAVATRLADAEMLYNVAIDGSCELSTFLRDYASDLFRSLPPPVRVIPPVASQALVAVSETVLRGALDNLVNNAVEAMPHGGELVFDYTVVSEENLVLLKVRDTGPGLPKQVIESLMSGTSVPSSKRHGSGLGLPGVMRVLRRVGGDLQPLDTTEGGGWLIILPLTSRSTEGNAEDD